MNGESPRKFDRTFRRCVYSYGFGYGRPDGVSCFRPRLCEDGLWKYHYEILDVDRTGLVPGRWSSLEELLLAASVSGVRLWSVPWRDFGLSRPSWAESEMSEVLL